MPSFLRQVPSSLPGALPEHLCIRNAWLGKKTQTTSPETAANDTEAGVDRTTKAYATASTDCLPVVAGVLPIDLNVENVW